MSLGKLYLKRLDKLALILRPRSAEAERQSIRMAAMQTLPPADCVAIAHMVRKFACDNKVEDTPEVRAALTRWSDAITRLIDQRNCCYKAKLERVRQPSTATL